MTKRVLVSWSTGKDSAWTLHTLRTQGGWEIGGLLTTLNETHRRVSMHAVRLELAEAQAQAADVPLRPVWIPFPCSDEAYAARLGEAVAAAVADGFTHVAFGDLFLEDVRRYRETRLVGSGLQPVFPLWRRPTRTLAEEMIAGGLRARVTCLDPTIIDRSLAGLEFDAPMLAALPRGVDPCGERGEFHTFVYDGPMFTRAIAIDRGEIVERDGFVFADLQKRTA